MPCTIFIFVTSSKFEVIVLNNQKNERVQMTKENIENNKNGDGNDSPYLTLAALCLTLYTIKQIFTNELNNRKTLPLPLKEETEFR